MTDRQNYARLVAVMGACRMNSRRQSDCQNGRLQGRRASGIPVFAPFPWHVAGSIDDSRTRVCKLASHPMGRESGRTLSASNGPSNSFENQALRYCIGVDACCDSVFVPTH